MFSLKNWLRVRSRPAWFWGLATKPTDKAAGERLN